VEVYPAITQQAHASDVEQSIDKVFFLEKRKVSLIWFRVLTMLNQIIF